jgi:hypothetical protein
MKNLVTILHRNRHFLYCLLCAVLFSCQTEKKDTEKTFPLTKDDIMVIYENGYKNGALNGLKNGYYDNELWKKDSVVMAVRWIK